MVNGVLHYFLTSLQPVRTTTHSLGCIWDFVCDTMLTLVCNLDRIIYVHKLIHGAAVYFMPLYNLLIYVYDAEVRFSDFSSQVCLANGASDVTDSN